MGAKAWGRSSTPSTRCTSLSQFPHCRADRPRRSPLGQAMCIECFGVGRTSTRRVCCSPVLAAHSTTLPAFNPSVYPYRSPWIHDRRAYPASGDHQSSLPSGAYIQEACCAVKVLDRRAHECTCARCIGQVHVALSCPPQVAKLSKIFLLSEVHF